MTGYFTDSEINGLQGVLVDRLYEARRVAGTPFIIDNGLRTVAENDHAHGVQDSAHLRGLAVDLACTDPSARMLIVKGLLAAGFSRIGIYDRHIHADVDKTLPQNVMWWGVSH